MERRLRLRESSDIKRVRGRGMAVAEGPFVARVLPNRLDPPQNRYTVVAGKKQGNAVKRNRVKRLAREALRHLDPLLVTGVDVLVLVRGKAEEVPDYATARALLDRIVARAGLLAEPGLAGKPGSGANAGADGQLRRSADATAPGDGERAHGDRSRPNAPSRATDAGAVRLEPRPGATGGGAAEGAHDARSAGERAVSVHAGGDERRGRARPTRHDRQATREGAGPSGTTDGRPTAGDRSGDAPVRRGGAG